MKTVLVKDKHKGSPLSPFEKKVLSFRKKVLLIVQNRKLDIVQRLSWLNELSNINLEKKSFNDWLKIFNKLEKLQINDFGFDNLTPTDNFLPIQKGFEREYEQLLSYLTFRHISRAFDLLDLKVRLAFVVLSFKMINHIFASLKEKTFENLVEVCRFYSSEIETSDDNIYCLLNEIENLISLI